MSRRAWPRHSAVLLLPLLAVAGVGAASGGYFATSFGWTALAFAWAAVVALVLVAPKWGAFDRVWLFSAAALCVYTFASAGWAGSVDNAVHGGERALVYLTGVAGALIVLRRGDFSRWLGGLVLGVAGVCVYSLATRLYPTHFGGFNTADYRLFSPVGYWNALGIFAAIALLLGFGLVALGRVAWLRVASAAALVVLAPTIYFTFSRGALIAVAVGIVAMFVLSPHRLLLLGAAIALGAVPAIGVLLAWRSHGLTHRSATLAAASQDGRRLALELMLLALVQAAVALGYVFASPRVRLSAVWRRGLGIATFVAIVVGLAGAVVTYGSPPTIARHAYHSFVATPTSSTNLNSRLFSLSNNGRTVLWHSAWREFLAHPVVGSGEGGFARWWLAHRTSPYFVLDAHNLYLQTLGELGAVGIALLALFLGLPLVAAVRARAHPLVAPAFGGYVAYLVHAAVDWDWQLPAVTLLALFTGAVIVASARRREPEPVGRSARIALGVGALAAAVVAFGGLIGNIALSRANDAVSLGLGRKAAAEGATAHRWAPWSARALQDLGDGRLLLGQKRSGLTALREAAAKDPGDWEIWFDIAAGTGGARNRAALARAKALNPQSPEIAAVEPTAKTK
jgi:O-Antigen ligase